MSRANEKTLHWRNAALLKGTPEGNPFALLQNLTRHDTSVWKLIGKAMPIFGRNPLNVLSTKHILIFAKSFMERDGLDAHRVRQCCYAIADTDGVFSFCAFNNLYRFPGRTAPLTPNEHQSLL